MKNSFCGFLIYQRKKMVKRGMLFYIVCGDALNNRHQAA